MPTKAEKAAALARQADADVQLPSSKYAAWRERMKRARRFFFTPAKIRELLAEADKIASDPERGSDQVRMLEFLLEQALGKASNKLELSTDTNPVASIEQRIELAKIAAGLLQQPQVVTVKTLPGPEVVEGEVIDGSGTRANGREELSADAERGGGHPLQEKGGIAEPDDHDSQR